MYSRAPESARTYRDAWLSDTSRGLVIVRYDLTTIWANPVAHQLAAFGINLSDGRLSIGNEAITDSLRRFVVGLDRTAGGWAATVPGGEQIVVRGDPTTPDGMDPAVVLTFQLAHESEKHIVWAGLQATFGLTKTETSIVKRLLGGSGAECIAAETSVTLDTIRTHIRRVYLKLGVRSREQLFARLLQFRVG